MQTWIELAEIATTLVVLWFLRKPPVGPA